jgi:hypothetical protein
MFNQVTLAVMGWEVLNHLLYSPDLASRNFKLMMNSNAVS